MVSTAEGSSFTVISSAATPASISVSATGKICSAGRRRATTTKRPWHKRANAISLFMMFPLYQGSRTALWLILPDILPRTPAQFLRDDLGVGLDTLHNMTAPRATHTYRRHRHTDSGNHIAAHIEDWRCNALAADMMLLGVHCIALFPDLNQTLPKRLSVSDRVGCGGGQTTPLKDEVYVSVGDECQHRFAHCCAVDRGAPTWS